MPDEKEEKAFSLRGLSAGVRQTGRKDLSNLPENRLFTFCVSPSFPSRSWPCLCVRIRQALSERSETANAQLGMRNEERYHELYEWDASNE